MRTLASAPGASGGKRIDGLRRWSLARIYDFPQLQRSLLACLRIIIIIFFFPRSDAMDDESYLLYYDIVVTAPTVRSVYWYGFVSSQNDRTI